MAVRMIIKNSVLLSFDEFFIYAFKYGPIVKFVKTTTVCVGTWKNNDKTLLCLCRQKMYNFCSFFYLPSFVWRDFFFSLEQWSPINTEGKKQYGRDFLLKLANDPLSKQKPSNMPPMDIIKDKPNQDKAKSFLPTGFAIFFKNVCFFFFIFTLLFHIRFLGLPSKDWTPGFVKSTTSKV